MRLWFTSNDVQERISAWPKNWREQAEAAYAVAYDRVEKRQ